MELAQVIFILISLTSATALKILGIFGHPGYSHFIVYRPLLIALSERGHEVTVLSYFPLKKSKPLYKDVVLKFPGDELRMTVSVNTSSSEYFEKYLGAPIAFSFAEAACGTALSLPEYKDLLDSDNVYDLIISEFFMSNCLLLPFAQKLKAPIIGIQSHFLMAWNYDWVANPDNPSYIPAMFLKNSDKMSFFERVENTVFLTINKLFYQLRIRSHDAGVIRQNLGITIENDFPNVSLILTNTHFSLQKSKPLVPGVVEIGGIHIRGKKSMPEHLEKWINESTHGVIYFSLGSMIKGHTFPEEKRQMFLRAFARFPQRILWKWETDTMPGKPENVMIDKWMPQFDILSHPNVKAFIAHGGLLGVTEAVHCGVPLIIMPQFGDQFTNAKAVEASGGGVILDYRSLDEESIYNALKTVLDPSFNKKAKELSARFRDRPMPPLETAIYWVEYVARHGGAPHLRTAAVGMPLYQYLLLDVIAFLAVVLLTIMYISFIVTRAIFRRIFKTNKVEKVKKN